MEKQVNTEGARFTDLHSIASKIPVAALFGAISCLRNAPRKYDSGTT